MNSQKPRKCHPSKTPLAWIGTGVMGAPMCAHLLKAGYQVTVHNRTQSKAEALIERGARWARTPAEAAKNADVVITMVGFPSDVREVYWGKEGIFRSIAPGSIIVDMTTTEPALAVEIAREARRKGVFAVDAPVSGGDIGARDATLSIMAGGEKETVEALVPVFDCLGRRAIHQGGAGAGQHAKMCNQITIAGTMIGVCESLLYAAKAGLDTRTLLESIRGGAAACWTLDNLAPRIMEGNYEPGFIIDHFVKDMGIVLKESQRMKLSLPGLALVHQLYVAVQAQGHGKKGTHALMLALESLAGIQP